MGEKMNSATNALNWFEIPVQDTGRAKTFYEKVFDISMNRMDMAGMEMVMFPPTGDGGHVGGALVKSAMHQPSDKGCKVYLNGNPDLQTVLDRIPAAGGNVKFPKTDIGEGNGFFAFFEDSEGNTVGIHSNN